MRDFFYIPWVLNPGKELEHLLGIEIFNEWNSFDALSCLTF